MNSHMNDNPHRFKKEYIKMRDGAAAQYVGVFRCPWTKKTLDIYTLNDDRPAYAEDSNYLVCTPTKTCIQTDVFKDEKLSNLIGNGIAGIAIHWKLWDELKKAREFEVYDRNYYQESATIQVTGNLNNMSIQNKSIVVDSPKKNSTVNMMGKAFVDGAKTVGAAQTNELISTGLKKMAVSMGLNPEYVNNDVAEFVLKLAGPALIHYLATTQSQHIDQLVGRGASEKIQEGTQLATQKVFTDFMEPLVQFLVPLLKELATGGLSNLGQEAAPEGSPNLDASHHQEENERVFGKQEAKEAVYTR